MKLSALPTTERTVFAFFSGDYSSVLRWTEGESVTDEQCFLRALSFDPIGLNQPDQLALNLRRLIIRHPDSVFTGLASTLLERTGSTALPPNEPTSPALAPSASPATNPLPAAKSVTEASAQPSTETSTPLPALSDSGTVPSPPIAAQIPATVPAASPTGTVSLPLPVAPAARSNGLPVSVARGVANPAALVLQRRDLNRDGKINLVELRLWLGPKAELREWDQNGDRELDRQEFQAFFEANPTR